MRFEFASPSRIVFGPGASEDLGKFASRFGRHAFVITGLRPERVAHVTDLLSEQGMASQLFSITNEPSVEIAQSATDQARDFAADVVIAVGGGSAIDTGKAVAALLANPGEALDYLEVIGRGKPITNPSVPFIAVPTTAGTGAEVTSNAVLYSAEHQVKVSLRSPHMLARIALVDPILTYSAPPEVTANSGLDALTQVLEPYVSNKANPMTDAICRKGMQRAAASLKRAFEDSADARAREDMSLVSLFGGLALSNAKLGAVHGFAGPFGGMFDAPHGAICARLLPFVTEMNITALRERDPDNPVLMRYDEVGRLLTGRSDANSQDAVSWLQDTCAALGVKPLGVYGLEHAHFDSLIDKAVVASSMQGNPIKLTRDELGAILEWAL